MIVQERFAERLEAQELENLCLATQIRMATNNRIRELVPLLHPMEINHIRIPKKQGDWDGDGDLYEISMGYNGVSYDAPPRDWEEVLWWAKSEDPGDVAYAPHHASEELRAVVLELEELCKWLVETTRGPKQPITF